MINVEVDSLLMRFNTECTKITNKNDVYDCPIHQYSVRRGKVAQVSFTDNGRCNMFVGGRNIQDLATIRQICLDCAYRKSR
ncbi:MAG: hypothetical protein NC311_02095 [Muribaculaceae bacterium]|nr:hypothetical protein [Muribaculaceae bacterium]